MHHTATGKTEDDESSDDDDEKSKSTALDKDHPYIKFWEQFGKSIKMGIIEDAANRSKLAKLLRYQSSKSNEKYTSLDDYVDQKPAWQKDIYYIAAESVEACQKSPFMEVARKKGVEVLFLVDPVDECIIIIYISSVNNYYYYYYYHHSMSN
jgi:heat shock protein beta